MSMRKSTRQELRKSREILRFLLRGKACYFCKKPLINGESYAKDGDGQASPNHGLPTIHHIDLNHRNDAEENKTLAHDSCHRSFHAILRGLLKRGIVMVKAIHIAKKKAGRKSFPRKRFFPSKFLNQTQPFSYSLTGRRP